MLATLLRRSGLLAGLTLLLFFMGAVHPARASHLLGGEMTYRYLDAKGPADAPLRYEITVTVYNNCGPSALVGPRPTAGVAIYSQSSPNRLALSFTNSSYAAANGTLNIPQTTLSACISPAIPPGCTITGVSQPYRLQKFVAVVNLPTSSTGYYAVFSDTARNSDVTNLYDPGNQAMSLYVALPPPSIPNRSPVFSDIAVAIICANDTTFLLNNAVDADGDRLVYSFGQPYALLSGLPNSFLPPMPTASYSSGYGYTSTTPFGTGLGNFATLNPNTGLATYGAATVGSKYAVAVDVREYRTINGQEQLIGTTRRDLQLVVASCPPTKSPVLPPVAVMARDYTIEAGSTLTVPITATQADKHPLDLTLNSVLLDGAGGYSATLNGNAGTLLAGNPTGTVVASGTSGTVSGTFVFTPGCDAARTSAYDVALTVKDNGCAGKTVADVLHITVTKPAGPKSITGDLLVCSLNSLRTYTAAGNAAPKISWRVVGGTIVGSSTDNTVQVQWGGAGTGTLAVRGVTQYGCLTDSVVKQVKVSQAATLAVTGKLSVCQGSSTTLTVTGGTAPYTVTGGPTTLTGAGPFTISPTQTTTYSITGAAAPNDCGANGQVTVTLLPLPTASVGAASRSTCSEVAITLGAGAVGGSTYSWSPATGLSSATVANPTLTLTNTTSAPVTQTYTLTETSANGCQASQAVTVTINPAAVAVPGAAVTVCSDSPARLGAAAVAGNTYSWSPATGLSSATVANPTLTLTNTTGAPLTQTYTLTTTNASGCTSTGTVAVTVNPAVVALPGAAVAFCSGGNAQLGAAAVAGNTYSWSPATGLSSASVANPTVTLTNTTGAPLTQTYTLTTTNASGCTSTGTVAVTVNPLPLATPGAAATFCSGGNAQLGAAAVAGNAYSWSPATGLSSATVANPTLTLTNTTGAPLTQTYTLTTTNASGCTSTGTVAVTVNPAVVALPGAAVAFCSGGNAQLGAAAVAGNTYSWSPATGLSSATVANPTLTLTNTTGAPLTQTYTLTTTNASGCTSTGTVAVTVNPAVVALPGAAATICSGSSARLGAAAGAGITYRWSPATGLSSATVANPTVTLTNTTGAPLTQAYFLTATNASGCVDTATVRVTVNSVVVPGSISAAQTVCLGTSPSPLTSTAGASGGTGTYGYQWESSADNATWAAITSATGLTYAPGPVMATTYYRRRVESGTCGVFYSNTIAVQAQTPVLTAVALATPPTQCAGTALTFSPVPTNAGAAPTYRWFVNNTLVASTPTFTSSTLANGDQVRVELTPTVGFCASGPAQATVAVTRTPVAQPALSITLQTVLPVCIGTPLTFSLANVTNPGPAPTYQWQVDGVDVVGAQSPVFTSATLRDGQLVTLTLRTTTVCGPVTVVSNKVRATLNPPLDVEAGPDKEIMVGEQVTLDGTANGTYPVTWAPALGLTFANGDMLHPTVSPLVTITYTLSAGVGTCADQSTVTVTVRPRLRIPNAISPNGDGENDTWQIDYLGDYAANHVLVFNRWGSKVFETSGYSRSNEWNGTISGQPAPVGTYYYVITLGNGRSYSGPLTVIY
jgi:gliding motility-associated-like protein